MVDGYWLSCSSIESGETTPFSPPVLVNEVEFRVHITMIHQVLNYFTLLLRVWNALILMIVIRQFRILQSVLILKLERLELRIWSLHCLHKVLTLPDWKSTLGHFVKPFVTWRLQHHLPFSDYSLHAESFCYLSGKFFCVWVNIEVCTTLDRSCWSLGLKASFPLMLSNFACTFMFIFTWVNLRNFFINVTFLDHACLLDLWIIIAVTLFFHRFISSSILSMRSQLFIDIDVAYWYVQWFQFIKAFFFFKFILFF